MCYSIEPLRGLFGGNMCKSIIKNMNSKYSKNLIVHAKQSVTDTFKIASKKQLVTWLVIKLLIKLQKPQKLYHRIIERKLNMKQKI